MDIFISAHVIYIHVLYMRIYLYIYIFIYICIYVSIFKYIYISAYIHLKCRLLSHAPPLPETRPLDKISNGNFILLVLFHAYGPLTGLRGTGTVQEGLEVYMCIYVCVFICVYMYVYIHIRSYVYIYMCILYINICMYIYIYTNVHI
jgi:hypothetical protein